MARKKAEPFPDVSGTQLGRLLGLSPNSVTRLIREKAFVRTGNGLFDATACIRAYLKMREEVIRAKWSRDGNAKARLAAARASLAELQLQERQGDVVDAAQVTRVVTAMIAQSRMRLLAIPTRVAPRLCMAKSVTEAEQMIAEAIHEALIDLSTAPLRQIEKLVEEAL
jgi:phage terminase Nu1 subunit (DNA packaging protein)